VRESFLRISGKQNPVAFLSEARALKARATGDDGIFFNPRLEEPARRPEHLYARRSKKACCGVKTLTGRSPDLKGKSKKAKVRWLKAALNFLPFPSLFHSGATVRDSHPLP
jgi:hypothetical protein